MAGVERTMQELGASLGEFFISQSPVIACTLIFLDWMSYLCCYNLDIITVMLFVIVILRLCD